jgi:hypothetical protein
MKKFTPMYEKTRHHIPEYINIISCIRLVVLFRIHYCGTVYSFSKRTF